MAPKGIVDLEAPISDPSAGAALAAWRWLIPDDVVPVLVTALGDVFVRNLVGEVWLLDTYRGLYLRVSSDERTWRSDLEDPLKVENWFQPALCKALRDRGLRLEGEQCYSPILPLAVGGTMAPENFECSSWALHMGLSAQLHEQNRRLADGTPIIRFKSDG